MRTNNHIAVGSPTVRVAAIVAATLLLAVALASVGVAGQRLLAANGPIVVAQDGSGTVATISEAVAMAEDGDEILVRPGTYAESIVVDKDVVMRGDGPVQDIVISASPDAPKYETGFSFNTMAEYALVLDGTDAQVSDLTFNGRNARLITDAGAPTLERLHFIEVGWPYEGGPSVQAVVIRGGATPVVRESTFVDGGGINIFEDSSPLIEKNELEGGPGIYGDFGDDTRILENHIHGPGEQGVDMGSAAAAVIRGNTVSDKTDGMWIMGGVLVEGNVVTNAGNAGISVVEVEVSEGAPTIRGNTLTDNYLGISWNNDAGVVEGNTITGGEGGIRFIRGAPEVRENTVTGAAAIGLMLSSSASPTLSGNTICDNTTNVEVIGDAPLQGDGTNEICEDAPTE